MKKNMIGLALLCCAVAVYIGIQANSSSAAKIDLLAQNVEALASGEWEICMPYCSADWQYTCTLWGSGGPLYACGGYRGR